ncbi:MAG: hypothetical protein B7Z80_14865 [Rhodospirillales bacterium 20-64-7]|nr:MAG: hypothetical protein B7Z80_14865 [Rhodospirillales bacterium 20-64-7]
MGNSSISLQSVYDAIAAKGVPDPRAVPSGYGDILALELATQVMADLICERFNWKWNRAVAAPIYTNSYQQDYPQPAQTAGVIGWGEDCDGIILRHCPVCERDSIIGHGRRRKQAHDEYQRLATGPDLLDVQR